jgi:hypothetical protein
MISTPQIITFRFALLIAVVICFGAGRFSFDSAHGGDRKLTPVEFCNVFLREHTDIGMLDRAALCVSHNKGDTPLARCMSVLSATSEAVHHDPMVAEFQASLWCKNLLTEGR